MFREGDVPLSRRVLIGSLYPIPKRLKKPNLMPIPLQPDRPSLTDDLWVMSPPNGPASTPQVPFADHVMAQFRPSFLQHSFIQVARNKGLDTLHARCPWGSLPLTPLLQAAASQHVRPMDAMVIGTELELRIHAPRIVALHGSDNGMFSDVLNNGLMARRAGGQGKRCEIRWQLSLDIFRPAHPDLASEVTGRPTTGSGVRELMEEWNVSAEMNATPDAPLPLPAGDRTTLGTGTVRMLLPMDVLNFAEGHQLWVNVLADGAEIDRNGNDAAMTEFMISEGFNGLWAQALAAWTAAQSVRITPVIMIGGDLPATQLPRSEWGALVAHVQVAADERGSLLCLGLRSPGQPTATRALSFLANKEFAYYVSERIFSPLMKARWRAHVPQQAMVKDVEFEAPLEEGSEATGTARARLRIRLHDDLVRCALITTEAGAPDRLQLAGTQTVQVLAYWDPKGHRAEDLGELGDARDMPMRFAMHMFDKPSEQPGTGLQSVVAGAIRRTVMPLYLPFHTRPALDKLSGATSAPLRAFIVRWNLERARPKDQAAAVGGISDIAIAL